MFVLKTYEPVANDAQETFQLVLVEFEDVIKAVEGLVRLMPSDEAPSDVLARERCSFAVAVNIGAIGNVEDVTIHRNEHARVAAAEFRQRIQGYEAHLAPVVTRQVFRVHLRCARKRIARIPTRRNGHLGLHVLLRLSACLSDHVHHLVDNVKSLLLRRVLREARLRGGTLADLPTSVNLFIFIFRIQVLPARIIDRVFFFL
mmetsp:Transcript_98157/g.277618  ORF Transcript_98157/g.277618 Transcript_98157/m.277618 type:complete len:202 (+) Transcript_98157:1-606(+)